MVSPELNAELVMKINTVRRRNSIQGEKVELMETFEAGAKALSAKTTERRKSLGGVAPAPEVNTTQSPGQQEESIVDHAELMRKATELADRKKRKSISETIGNSIQKKFSGREGGSQEYDSSPGSFGERAKNSTFVPEAQP